MRDIASADLNKSAWSHGLSPYLSLLIVAAVSGFILGCGPQSVSSSKSQRTGEKAQEKPVLVELTQISRGRIEAILERSSALEAEAHVQVLARTQNPAIELLVEEGDVVKKNEVLLRLESDRQRTVHAQAESGLEEARIEFDSQQALYDQNLISDSEYRTFKFAFEQARLQEENALRELEYTEVRAPIGGTVTKRMVKVGDSVSTGTPIFEIIDLNSTVAVIYVPEQYIPKLNTNMAARMVSSTLSNQVFEGFIKRISPVVDAQAGTIKVVVGLKDLGALRPGMWVDVELVLDAKSDAILIPKQAIVYDNDQTYVFKAYQDTNGIRRARRELVVPRNADKRHIEPIKGFEPGDWIVVAGQTGLKDDAPIRELTPPDSGERTPSESDPANIRNQESDALTNEQREHASR